MALRAKSKLACAIARLDTLRLNESIHAGFYTCAPETRPGAARVYEIDQIVSLRIYGILLALSLSAERAGHIACAAYSQFNGRDDVSKVVYTNTRAGAWHTIAIPADGKGNDQPPFAMIFDIADLRKEITAHLEYEDKNRVVGED